METGQRRAPTEADPWGGAKTMPDDPDPVLVQGKVSGYGQYVDVWYPKELAPGLTMPFRIGMPGSQLRPLPREVVTRPTVHWVEVNGEAEAMNEVAFFLSDPEVQDPPAGTWPGRSSMGTRLLVRHRMPDKRTLWLTSRWYLMNAEEVMWAHAYRPSVSPSRITEQVDRERYDVSSWRLVGDPAYGSCAIVESGP